MVKAVVGLVTVFAVGIIIAYVAKQDVAERRTASPARVEEAAKGNPPESDAIKVAPNLGHVEAVVERSPSVEQEPILQTESVAPEAVPAASTGEDAPATPIAETPEPSGAVDMAAHISHPKVLSGGQRTVYVNLELKAQEARPANRLPLNVALVVDRSGSMRGAKLRDAREAARGLLQKLEPQDRVSLVSYSTTVSVDFPASVLSDTSIGSIERAIDRLSASGSTNLSGGLVAGRDQVRAHASRNQVNRVLLISDGIANVGVTAQPELNRIAREASQTGVLLSTIGLGDDYNEDLMTALADYGGGGYYYVRESADLAAVLQREADLMASTVAQRASLEITLGDGVQLQDLFGYTYSQEGDTVVVPLAELFAGQERNVVIALRVFAGAERELDIAKVRFSYEDVTTDQPARRSRTAEMRATSTADSREVDEALDRAVMARVEEIHIAGAMREAAAAYGRGDAAGAQHLLNAATKRARAKGYASPRLEKSLGAASGLLRSMDDAKDRPAERKAIMKKGKASSWELAK